MSVLSERCFLNFDRSDCRVNTVTAQFVLLLLFVITRNNDIYLLIFELYYILSIVLMNLFPVKFLFHL